MNRHRVIRFDTAWDSGPEIDVSRMYDVERNPWKELRATFDLEFSIPKRY